MMCLTCLIVAASTGVWRRGAGGEAHPCDVQWCRLAVREQLEQRDFHVERATVDDDEQAAGYALGRCRAIRLACTCRARCPCRCRLAAPVSMCARSGPFRPSAVGTSFRWTFDGLLTRTPYPYDTAALPRSAFSPSPTLLPYPPLSLLRPRTSDVSRLVC